MFFKGDGGGNGIIEIEILYHLCDKFLSFIFYPAPILISNKEGRLFVGAIASGKFFFVLFKKQ